MAWCILTQCVLYYMINKILLLGTSLYKPYCSEVHLLNQHYLQICPTVCPTIAHRSAAKTRCIGSMQRLAASAVRMWSNRKHWQPFCALPQGLFQASCPHNTGYNTQGVTCQTWPRPCPSPTSTEYQHGASSGFLARAVS